MKITISEAQDYLYCGLYHKYKYTLGFPYLSSTAEEAYAHAMRMSMKYLLKEWGIRRRPTRQILHTAGLIYHQEADEQFTSALINPLDLYSLSPKALLVLGRFSRYLNLTKDVVAISDMEYSITLSDIVVEDKVDAIIIKNDHKPKERSYLLTTIIDDRSHRAVSARGGNLHVGFARHALVTGMQPRLDRPIDHQFMSVFGTEKDLKPTKYHDVVMFGEMMNKIGTAIKAKIALPTVHKPKCQRCFYRDICTNKFVQDHIPVHLERAARKRLNEYK